MGGKCGATVVDVMLAAITIRWTGLRSSPLSTDAMAARNSAVSLPWVNESSE